MPYLQQLVQDGQTVYLTPNGGGTIQLGGVETLATASGGGIITALQELVTDIDFSTLGLPSGIYTATSALTITAGATLFSVSAPLYWDAATLTLSGGGTSISLQQINGYFNVGPNLTTLTYCTLQSRWNTLAGLPLLCTVENKVYG
jgi:hypothetical protein